MALRLSIPPSAVRRDQSLAHPGGGAAKAASREGWVKGQPDLEPQRGETELGCNRYLCSQREPHPHCAAPQRGLDPFGDANPPFPARGFAAPPPGWANLLSRLTALRIRRQPTPSPSFSFVLKPAVRFRTEVCICGQPSQPVVAICLLFPITYGPCIWESEMRFSDCLMRVCGDGETSFEPSV